MRECVAVLFFSSSFSLNCSKIVMVADSITDSQQISRDFVKKQKVNWFWKLKQWMIDARHRQWIYQWKRANVGEEENGCSRLRSLRDKPPDIKTLSDRFSYLQVWSIDHHELRSYEFAKCDDDSDDAETHLSASSPTSVLKNKDSDSNKNEDDCFCCCKQIKEDEEEAFDDAYENWDVFSDALNSFDNEENERPLQHEQDPNPNTSQRNKSSTAKLIHKDKCKQEPSPEKAIHHKVSREIYKGMCKQETSPEKAIHHKVSRMKEKSDQKKEGDEISECPICSEEMDATDLSFVPCPCGFKLCLFCHKQINENDGRCPGCRNKYAQTSSNRGEVSFQQRGRGKVRLSPSFKGLDRA